VGVRLDGGRRAAAPTGAAPRIRGAGRAMSGLLDALAALVVGTATTAQPRPALHFEPSDEFGEVTVEREGAPQPPSVRDPVAPPPARAELAQPPAQAPEPARSPARAETQREHPPAVTAPARADERAPVPPAPLERATPAEPPPHEPPRATTPPSPQVVERVDHVERVVVER